MKPLAPGINPPQLLGDIRQLIEQSRVTANPAAYSPRQSPSCKLSPSQLLRGKFHGKASQTKPNRPQPLLAT
ncbi:MAG: hypothetical protein LWW81_16175, partial [Rhodocyclales bacterium]|nr:hypothetical protein [Rhodocyclales bacterium]